MLNTIKIKIIAPLSVILWSVMTQVALAQAKCYKFGKEVPCEELGGLLGWGLGLMALVFIVGIVFFIFWIIMIIHAASKPIENKALWIILLVFTGIVGALIYYFVVKRNFDRQPTQT